MTSGCCSGPRKAAHSGAERSTHHRSVGGSASMKPFIAPPSIAASAEGRLCGPPMNWSMDVWYTQDSRPRTGSGTQFAGSPPTISRPSAPG